MKLLHSYADSSTLRYSTAFSKLPSLEEVLNSWEDAAEHFTFDLTVISD